MKLERLLPNLGLLALAAGTFAACTADETGQGGQGTGGDPYADVTFEAGATDEALDALLAATATTDNYLDAAFILTPQDGTTLELESPLKFTWQVGPPQTGAREIVPLDIRLGRTVRHVPSFLSELEAILGPEREAHAHGDPVNGPAFLLRVRDARGVDVHRAFTTAFEHTPSRDVWTTLSNAEQPLAACIVSAVFEENRVAPDGGPYEGPWIALSF